jgi:hypothetical protein
LSGLVFAKEDAGHKKDHFLTDTTKHEKMADAVGAAVPGRLWLAGTEARPTRLFSYKVQ